MKQVLVISHLNIQNANALSSPYTIGFPAMTAWLGAVHALQRHLLNQGKLNTVRFNSVAVICHAINLQVYRGKADYISSIVLTGNPLDKDGNRSTFSEEARCHLDVSLVIEYQGIVKNMEDAAIDEITTLLYARMKMAGGDILKIGDLEFLTIDGPADLHRLTMKLMPGYVLIERRDLMEKAMRQGRDAIDAVLDYLKVMRRSDQDQDGRVKWTGRRKVPGWIVPIATGFHGISALGFAENQRDQDTPHRFAESVVTLGEFVMPYRIADIEDMLWHYHTDIENNLYLCQQNNRKISRSELTGRETAIG